MTITIKPTHLKKPATPDSSTWWIYESTDDPSRGPVLICKEPLGDDLLSLDSTGLRRVGLVVQPGLKFIRAVPMENFNITEV